MKTASSSNGNANPRRSKQDGPIKLEVSFGSTLTTEAIKVDLFLRKEVIQPHLPVRLPCYDLVPITGFTFGASLLAVGSATSGTPDSRGLTGGVYKAQEHIHRGVLIRDY